MAAPASSLAAPRRRLVGAVTSIVALGAASFAFLRPTNFRGYDEWVIASLLSRGILSFPHANRPLNLIWHVPAWLVAPDRLWGFLLVHAGWLTAAGVLTLLIVRRLVPGAGPLAFLSGALAVVWMPSEPTRVSSVQMALYSGCTVGVLLATWLLLEAWCRRRPLLLVPAALAAAAAGLSLEAAFPALAFAPLLLLFAGGTHEVRRWLCWTGGAALLVGALAARMALPMLTGGDELSYQLRLLSVTPSPWSVGRRISIRPTGVVSERAPVLRGPWREETLRYRYDEIVVFLEHENGVLSVLDSWPEDLGPLPPGQAYSPRSRIRADQPRPKRVAILDAKP